MARSARAVVRVRAFDARGRPGGERRLSSRRAASAAAKAWSKDRPSALLAVLDRWGRLEEWRGGRRAWAREGRGAWLVRWSPMSGGADRGRAFKSERAARAFYAGLARRADPPLAQSVGRAEV